MVAWALQSQKKKGRFALRIVECGWPGKWSSKFLTIGELSLKETEIFTKVEGRLHSLNDCPQKDFFRTLDQASELRSDPYFQLAETTLSTDDFDFWLESRQNLWKNFQAGDPAFFPIVTMTSKGVFVVEDGAHRLALESLRGKEVFRVRLSLWAMGDS